MLAGSQGRISWPGRRRETERLPQAAPEAPRTGGSARRSPWIQSPGPRR